MSQLNTWAHRDSDDISILWLRGSDQTHFSLVARELYVPCREDYSKILEKTVLGIKFALEHIEFDVLVRSNVSTYFDLNRMIKELSRVEYKSDFCGGYVDKTKGGYFDNPASFEYLSGTGIFMSRTYAQLLSNLNVSEFTDIPDDVAISEFFKRLGSRRIRMKRNNLSSTHIFFPSFHIRAKSSTDSDLAGRRMVLLNRYFESQSFWGRINIYFSIQAKEFLAFIRHPESFSIYLLRNRVVFFSYIRMRAERLFQ